jgi:hypothetical protein
MLSHIKVVGFGTHRLGPDEIGQVHPSAVQEDCELIWDDQHRSAKNFEKKCVSKIGYLISPMNDG